MIVKYSTEKIFWNTIGDNKPSKSYLDSLENRMIEDDIKINFEDFFNISVVSSRKDISYILTTHNGYKQYWFYNGIKKIINGGYVINYQLDLYATYTTTFLEHLKANNVKVKLNRSHKFKQESMYIKDDLLDNVVKMYDGYEDELIPTTRYIGTPQNRKYILSGSNDLSYVRLVSLGSVEAYVGNGNLYYVFEIVSKGKLVMFPVLYDSGKDQFNLFQNMYYQLDTPLSTPTPGNTEIEIFNTKNGLEELKSSQKYSNKFIGIFIFKNFYSFQRTEGVYDFYKYVNSGDPLDGRYYACLTVDISGARITNDKIVIKDNVSNVLAYNQQVPMLNYKDKIHQYALKYYDYQYMGSDINGSLLYDDLHKEINISDYVLNFTQSGFLKINLPDNIYNFKEGIITYPANLPSWEDNYLNYVNANKNQRDNQLNILKQQYEKNLASNVFNSILGIGSSVASGDIVGGVKSLFNNSMGFANTIQGYQNAKNTMKAQYDDAMNTMGQSINAGNIEDCLVGYFNSNFSIEPSYLVRHKTLTQDTIMNLNNIIYLYGANNPQIDTLTNFTVRSDFNYYLFDKQYLKHILPQNINVDVPQEIFPYIIEQLSNGVRIWNIQPTN